MLVKPYAGYMYNITVVVFSSACKKYSYLGPIKNGADWYPKNGTLKVSRDLEKKEGGVAVSPVHYNTSNHLLLFSDQHKTPFYRAVGCNSIY